MGESFDHESIRFSATAKCPECNSPEAHPTTMVDAFTLALSKPSCLRCNNTGRVPVELPMGKFMEVIMTHTLKAAKEGKTNEE